MVMDNPPFTLMIFPLPMYFGQFPVVHVWYRRYPPFLLDPPMLPMKSQFKSSPDPMKSPFFLGKPHTQESKYCYLCRSLLSQHCAAGNFATRAEMGHEGGSFQRGVGTGSARGLPVVWFPMVGLNLLSFFTGWWFGTFFIFHFFHILGIIILTD